MTLRRGTTQVADALIKQGNPTKNYGGSQSLSVVGGSSGETRALLRFDTSTIPGGVRRDVIARRFPHSRESTPDERACFHRAMVSSTRQSATPGPSKSTHPASSAAAGNASLKRELRGASFDAGEARLAAGAGPVQNTSAPAQAKAPSGKASTKDADWRFDYEWGKLGKTKETIEAARKATIDIMGGGLPKGWVPAPLRNQGKPADASQYKPDASNSTQTPEPEIGSDLATGETSLPADQLTSEADPLAERRPDGTVPDIKAPKTQAPEAQAQPKSGGTESTSEAPDAAPGPVVTDELGLPLKGPFGFSLAYNSEGKTEAAGKVEIASLPSFEVACAPVPIVLGLKPELSGNFKIARTASGDWDLTASIEYAAAGTLGFGEPGLSLGGGVKLKSSTSIGATYNAKTGWAGKPLETALSGSPIIYAKVGGVSWEKALDEYELAAMSITLMGGIKLRKGKDVDRLWTDIKNWASPLAEQHTGPEYGESGNHG